MITKHTTRGRNLETSRKAQAIILDTNVISELVRPEPNPLVSEWYLQQDPAIVYTTAVTLAETLFGLETMPQGRRRNTLTELTYAIFDDVLYGKVLPFDEVAAFQFGRCVLKANEEADRWKLWMHRSRRLLG